MYAIRSYYGYDAVIGALNRQIETQVNWAEIDEQGTVGIDEIAQHKGRHSYTAIVSCRQKKGEGLTPPIIQNSGQARGRNNFV